MRIVEKTLNAQARVLTACLLAGLMISGGACSLFNKGENSSGDVQGQPAVLEPVAGRLSQVSGDVAINHQIDVATENGAQAAPDSSGSQPAAQPTEYAPPPPQPNQPSTLPAPNDQSSPGSPDWTQASNNMPLTVGDRIYVPDGGRAAVGFSGRKYVRVDPGSTLDVVALSKNNTQLALRSGSAMFDIGELQPGERYEVDTPSSAVDFVQPGLYQLGFNQDGSVVLTVLNGQAQVLAQGGSETVSRGQVITIPSSEAAAPASAEAGSAPVEEQPVIADVAPDVCGNIVNDYYSYRYGSAYDGRYADYNTYLSDPYYYDPYQRTESYQYCGDDDYVAGLDDLNGNGDWIDAGGDYGHCWFPHVAAGWVPYQSGYWVQDGPLGMSWCASEPWGWAPYHYGRWAYINNRWGWVPKLAVSEPVYSPALVAFVSLGGGHDVGWCPLGPGDPWTPHYYAPGFRPYYVGSEVNISSPRNLLIAGAVTAVAVAALTRPISPAVAVRVDAGMLRDSRPFLDPYRDASFRQASVQLNNGRPRAFVPPAVQQQVVNRPVVAFNKPNLPAPLASSAPARYVQPLPSGVQKQRLAVNRSQTAVSIRQPNGLPMAAPQVRGNASNQAPGAFPGQPSPQGRNPQSQNQTQQGQLTRQQQKQAQAQQQAQQREQAKQQRQQQAQQQQLAQQQAKQQRQQQAQLQRQQQLAQQQQAKQQRQQQAAQQRQQQLAQQQQKQQRKQQAEQQRQQQLAQQQQAKQQRQQAEQQRQQQLAQQQQAKQQRQQQAEQQRRQQLAQQQQAKQQRQQQAEQQRQQQAAQQQQAKQQRQQQAAQQRQQQAAQQQQAKQQRQEQAAQQRQQQAAQQQQAKQQRQQQAAQQRQQQAAQQQQAKQQRQQQAAQQQQARQQARQQAQQQRQHQAAQQQRPPQPKSQERPAKPPQQEQPKQEKEKR